MTLRRCCLVFLLMVGLTASGASQNAQPLPVRGAREVYPNLEVIYDHVLDGRGERLRTIITHPRSTSGKLPTIFVLGWLSCDSISIAPDAKDGSSLALRELVMDGRFVVIRMDKPGVGDSEGVCAETDFDTELSGYKAAFASLTKYSFVDPARVFALGISNGGGFAPLAAPPDRVRGYVVVGGWMKTWYEHMIEIERRRLALGGKSPGEVNDSMKATAELYTEYLIRRRTPAEVIAANPRLAAFWTGDGKHQYGRPVAFYQQLQELNLAAAWEQVRVPVLVLHGQYDWIMSRADHEMIVDLVNHNAPGHARFMEVPSMGHTFEHYANMDEAFHFRELPFDRTPTDTIKSWLSEQTTTSPANR